MPTCQNCGRFFSSTSSHKYHVLHKVCLPKIPIENKDVEKIHLKPKVQLDNMCHDVLNIFTKKNFPDKIKLKIIKKTAKCQMCGLQTECGECAHIVASGKNGPRNKYQLVNNDVISKNYEINKEGNGLYLCANCHTLIDNYPDKYTYEYLINLKNQNQSKSDNDITSPTVLQSIISQSTECTQSPNLLHNALSKHPDNFIVYLVKKTDCNPKLSASNSIEITNKDPIGRVHVGEKFIFVPKKKIVTQLIENKRHMVKEYIDKNRDEYDLEILKKYHNYIDSLDNDLELQKDLEINITCMLLNISDNDSAIKNQNSF